MKCEAIVPFFAALLAVGLGQMPGGIEDADIHEPLAQEALNFAVAEHNKASNDMYHSKVAEVLSVQRQVVSGLKYIITMKMVKTNCRKNTANGPCASQLDSEPYTCTFTVWMKPWENHIQLVNEKC